MRILLYLRSTIDVDLKFTAKSLEVLAYSDADWAGDLDTRRSTTGYVVYAGGGPIAWQSKLQPTVAASTMEAEYMAAFFAIQELVWVKGVLSELGINLVDRSTLRMGSKSAISLARNPTHHKRSKHIDIKFHWIRDHVEDDGEVELEHCDTGDMDADLLTKALAFEPAVKHTKNMTGNGEVR